MQSLTNELDNLLWTLKPKQTKYNYFEKKHHSEKLHEQLRHSKKFKQQKMERKMHNNQHKKHGTHQENTEYISITVNISLHNYQVLFCQENNMLCDKSLNCAWIHTM